MATVIGSGIQIGGGITIDRGFVPSATLVYDLDAADVQGLYSQYKARFGY